MLGAGIGSRTASGRLTVLTFYHTALSWLSSSEKSEPVTAKFVAWGRSFLLDFCNAFTEAAMQTKTHAQDLLSDLHHLHLYHEAFDTFVADCTSKRAGSESGQSLQGQGYRVGFSP